MKTIILQFAALCVGTAAFSQVSSEQQRNSLAVPWVSAGTNQTGALIAGTNQFGQNYSVNDLAARLAELHTAVAQALPTLAAFNSQLAASGPSHGQQLANAISGVLSGALGKNTNQALSSGVTNVAQTLSGLLGTSTNNSGSAALDSSTISQLRALQTDLTPVSTILQTLHVGTNSFGSNQVISAQPSSPAHPVAPTGR